MAAVAEVVDVSRAVPVFDTVVRSLLPMIADPVRVDRRYIVTHDRMNARLSGTSPLPSDRSAKFRRNEPCSSPASATNPDPNTS